MVKQCSTKGIKYAKNMLEYRRAFSHYHFNRGRPNATTKIVEVSSMLSLVCTIIVLLGLYVAFNWASYS